MEMIKLSCSHTDSEKKSNSIEEVDFSVTRLTRALKIVCVGHLHANQMAEKQNIKGSCKCHILANLNSPVQLEQEKGLCRIQGLFRSICSFF